MEKREELLWRKLKVEITPNHQNMRIRRASIAGLTNHQVPTFHSPIDQSSEITSPTFRKHYSIKSQTGEEAQQSFSFGQQMLHDIQTMLKHPSHESNFEKNYLTPKCVQCETLNSSRNQRTVSRTIVDQIVQKMNNFVVEANFLIKSLKLTLNSYSQSFESQKQLWGNSLNLILANFQSKKQHQKKELQQKIQKMQQQNYFNVEKYKILQKKSNSLQNQINELINAVNSERINNQVLNKKVFELNEQLHLKIAQNNKLLQTTCSLKLKLNNSISNNVNQISQINSPGSTKKQKINKLGLNLNQLSGIRTKFSKSQYDTSTSAAPFQMPTSARECFPDFTQSLTFSNVKNDVKHITSPVLKSDSNCSNISGRVLQQKQKNCYKLNKLLTQPPKVQTLRKEDKIYDNSCKTSRKNSCNSIISNLYERRGSLNTNYEMKGFQDKNKLFDKIKKLREDINTEISDMRKDN